MHDPWEVYNYRGLLLQSRDVTWTHDSQSEQCERHPRMQSSLAKISHNNCNKSLYLFIIHESSRAHDAVELTEPRLLSAENEGVPS